MSADAGTEVRLVLLGEERTWIAMPGKETLVIGSSPDRAGFVVTGQGVDAVHCAVGRAKGGGWAIKDLGSEYGTIVNGAPVTSVRLWTGDVIVLGSRRLQVVDPTLPPPGSAAPTPEPAAKAPAPLEEIEAPPAPAERTATEKHRRLGGFRLDKLLGRGGMGSVHLALQESLNRPVALKVLSPKLAADHDFVRRFQTEARAAAALSHPNVVVVHDVGEADGHHFLAMEFMPGGTLEDRVSTSGPMPWRQVLDALHDAAAGLVYAEECGIVHRDIKPANLMLTGTGTVKIADLGLATTVEAEATQSEGKKIFGTPHFISPEQARGEALDHRSDLYSLGATAYRLLTGHTPFEGETTRDILRGHFTLEPAPLADHVPGIPAGLDTLVHRLLEKDPADRHPRAAVLLREVDRLRLEADGEELAPPPTRRRPFPLGAVAGIVVLAVGATAVWKLLPKDEPPPVDITEGPGPAVPEVPPPLDDSDFFEGTPPVTDTESEDEARLRILDLEAQLAHRDLPAGLEATERIERLRAILAQYPGTETALRVADEIRELEAHAVRADREAAELRAALEACTSTLRTAAAWPPPPGELPAPGPALEALAAYAPPAPLAESPEYRAHYDGLVREILATSAAAFRAELDSLLALAQGGDFAAVRPRLTLLAERLALPAYEADSAPAGLEALSLLEVETRALAARLDSMEEAWNAARADGDRARLAGALGHASNLAERLAKLELEGAAEALLALAPRLATKEARDRVQTLANDFLRAHEALMALAQEFDADGWRRRAVPDPRGSRTTTRDATGVDSEGILVSVDGGSERIPWAAFGGSVEWIEKLFKGRIKRAYTAEEQEGILVLLDLAATVEARELSKQVLMPESRSIFQPSEAAAMTELFVRVERWVEEIPEPRTPELEARLRKIARDREAATILARGLLASQEGAWSTAVGELETLFSDYQSSLLVSLLSDGSGWEAEAPAEPTPPPAPVEAPRTGPALPGGG